MPSGPYLTSRLAYHSPDVAAGGVFERRREVVRRSLEHRAARAHQVGDPVPVMQLVGGEGRDALLVVHRVADLDQLVEGLGQAEARALDQVVARGAHDHGAGFPGVAEGLALGVLHRRLRAAGEILRVPGGRRVLGVLGEGVEVGHPAGADPAAGIDEGAVDDVERRALGRQLQVGALVVDGEGLHVEIDLDAGLLLELREVGLQVLEVGRLEARAVDRRAGIGLAALGVDGGRRERAEGAAQNRTPTEMCSCVLPPVMSVPGLARYYV